MHVLQQIVGQGIRCYAKILLLQSYVQHLLSQASCKPLLLAPWLLQGAKSQNQDFDVDPALKGPRHDTRGRCHNSRCDLFRRTRGSVGWLKSIKCTFVLLQISASSHVQLSPGNGIIEMTYMRSPACDFYVNSQIPKSIISKLKHLLTASVCEGYRVSLWKVYIRVMRWPIKLYWGSKYHSPLCWPIFCHFIKVTKIPSETVGGPRKVAVQFYFRNPPRTGFRTNPSSLFQHLNV